MLRSRGSKRHTTFQTYERFYFLLWCVPSPCSCPLSNSTSYSTTTLVSVGAVLQQLTKTITISVMWVFDYLPFVILDMDSFTKNHNLLIAIILFMFVVSTLYPNALTYHYHDISPTEICRSSLDSFQEPLSCQRCVVEGHDSLLHMYSAPVQPLFWL